MAARILPLICLLLVLSSSAHNWITPITAVDIAASFHTSTSPATSSCFAADLAALRSFAANCAPDAQTKHWKGDDCCSWVGVTCTTSTTSSEPAAAARRVSGLDLAKGQLTGPEALLSLCSLSALSSLKLSQYRHFPLSMIPTVSIPECIGANLTNLQTLVLSHFGSALTGSIPQSLSRLRSLTYLDLSSNSLSGSNIPACDAPHLVYLDLSSNAFSGNISDFFSRSSLPSLSVLDLSENSLSGDLPPFDPSRFSSLQYLRLGYNHIAGSLPESLCELTTLQCLSLTSNALTGGIPSQCQTLANLYWLDLSHNRFTGPFPSWVGSFSDLITLDLSYNDFAGRLPDQWQKLSNLSTLILSGNSLLPHDHPNSPILLPLWLFQLQLTYLSLASMRLQPADLDCTSRLLLLNATIKVLDLSRNNLNGNILWCLSAPHNNFPSLSQLNMSGNPLALTLNGADPVKLLLMKTSMSSLDLSSCELDGSLTHIVTQGTMLPIQVLSLANNRLVGEIPSQLGNSSRLWDLDLSNNSFTGFSPFEDHSSTLLSLYSEISYLKLSNNNLQGDLSSTLLNLFNFSGQECGLIDVDLSHNFLTGGITASLGKCVSLSRLKLNDNLLEGIVPDELFNNLSGLQILSLSNNHLSGPVLSSFGNNKDLVLLDLCLNSFVGELQTLFTIHSHSNFAKLRVLLLGYNNFTGSIPLSLGNYTPALQVIDLSFNSLIGPIPDTLQQLHAFQKIQDTTITSLSVQGTLFEEFIINTKGDTMHYTYALEVLTTLDLSGNQLSGPIPTSFGVLSGLVYLNLSRNNLFGPIPSDLGKLSVLESLDLSYNQLSGSIPTSFNDLTKLGVFNVSYNEGLNGSIPHQPQFEVPESYIGDLDLCGEPTLHACAGPALADQPGDKKEEENSSFPSWIDEWVSIPALCFRHLVGFLGTLALIKMWWRR